LKECATTILQRFNLDDKQQLGTLKTGDYGNLVSLLAAEKQRPSQAFDLLIVDESIAPVNGNRG
jgi:hypothetical protein